MSRNAFVSWVAAPLLAIGISMAEAAGQDITPADSAAPQPAAAQPNGEQVRLFLDCNYCDSAYLRTEITFVDYVRDRSDADVHLLVAVEGAGGGSTQYTLQFLGLGRFADVNDEVRFATAPTDSQDDVRRMMSQVMKAGLLRYVARTPMAQRLQLSFSQPAPGAGAEGTGTASVRDPWNAWVFRGSVSGSIGREASYNNFNMFVSGSANRTTAAWKTNISFSSRMSESNTRVRDDWVTNDQRELSFSGLNVKSISDHWSVGGRTNANHSTFQNRDLALRLAPAIEYNVFPYSESTRRQLTVQYSVGANQVQYLEETIYSRTQEALFDQALEVGYSTRQPWGSASLRLEGSHYLHDLSRYRMEAGGSMDLRLFRGFGLTFSGSAQRIHDQLHLVKGNLTDEQILLRQRQIASAYRVNASVGVSYSFGSIFTPVVNPRMSGGGGF